MVLLYGGDGDGDVLLGLYHLYYLSRLFYGDGHDHGKPF